MVADILLMRRSLGGLSTSISWPDGTKLAPFDLGMSDELEALLREAYQGGGDPAAYANWYIRVSSDEEFDPTLIFVAVDEKSVQIAGVCHLWTSAFVKDLAVSPAWRRKGLGTALLECAIQAMARRGYQHLDLKVEADNPYEAGRLYRNLGFTVVQG